MVSDPLSRCQAFRESPPLMQLLQDHRVERRDLEELEERRRFLATLPAHVREAK